ncbi:MAG: hydantoinase/oxoprolinase family protein, partial [Candidatus Marinimicrobia bacterium]|nr:hydantoinase/oxoprolinase family protein [Candidatus Neomarinimicrobiota bacterium]
TTAGFEDVLEIGRELRYDIYDLNIQMPKPLVPRNLRVGVTERVDKKGTIVTDIDKNELKSSVQKLIDQGVEAIAVCYLFGFINPVHEKLTADYIQKYFPEIYVSISSEIMPEIREYERASATTMNAYVQPLTHTYLSRLESRLQDMGISGVINIMLSSGRLTTIEGAKKSPIHLLESGPAGGTMAGVFVGKQTGRSDLFAFDMGGTTAKASLIHNNEPDITNQFEAGRVRRFRKGSGLPVRIPVIDMIEIGAGGGSIAKVNQLGLLTVGPESAGSEPGPACYDRGGEFPTVTDSDLVLGYLNQDYFLGGTMKLNRQKAEESIRIHLAEPLGLSVEDAALGVHRVVNENMANAARVHILEKGQDPRHYTMMAFGGAGPVHAFHVAQRLNLKQLMAPVGAGVASAIGFLVSPVAVESVRSHVDKLSAMNWNQVNEFLNELESNGRNFLAKSGIPDADVSVTRQSDMRYLGQGFEIKVTIPNEVLSEDKIGQIEQKFSEVYKTLYSRTIDDVPIESVTWRVLTKGPSPEIRLQQVFDAGEHSTLKGHRHVRFADMDHAIECPVYSRYGLIIGDKMKGPAIIEEKESTFVIGPNSEFSVDNQMNIIVDIDYE